MDRQEHLQARLPALAVRIESGDAEAKSEYEQLVRQIEKLEEDDRLARLARVGREEEEARQRAAAQKQKDAEWEEQSRDASEQMRTLAATLDKLTSELSKGVATWRWLILQKYLAEHALGRAHGDDYLYAQMKATWPIRSALGGVDGIDPAPSTAPATFEAIVG